MIRVLFVCHGNICRSPMAEFVFRDLAARRGVAGRFSADSAGDERRGDRQPGSSRYGASAPGAGRGHGAAPRSANDAGRLRAL